MIYLQIISGFNDWIAVKTGFLLVSWEMVKLVGYYNIGNFMNSFEDLTIRIIHIQNLLKWFIFPIFWISSCQMRKFQFHIDQAYPNGSLRITSSRYRAYLRVPILENKTEGLVRGSSSGFRTRLVHSAESLCLAESAPSCPDLIFFGEFYNSEIRTGKSYRSRGKWGELWIRHNKLGILYWQHFRLTAIYGFFYDEKPLDGLP